MAFKPFMANRRGGSSFNGVRLSVYKESKADEVNRIRFYIGGDVASALVKKLKDADTLDGMHAMIFYDDETGKMRASITDGATGGKLRSSGRAGSSGNGVALTFRGPDGEFRTKLFAKLDKMGGSMKIPSDKVDIAPAYPTITFQVLDSD